MNETATCEVQKSKETIKQKIRWFKQDMKWKFEAWLQRRSMSVVRWTVKDSNYISHAKREFLSAGYIPLNQPQEDDPNKWIQENILDLLAVLSSQGHSGGSIGYAVNAFKKLARFEPMTPIKCTDGEWNDVGRFSDDKDVYQNNRLSSVFKNGKDGIPHYNEAIVWRGQSGITFTGSVSDSEGNIISSSQNIKLPFLPKTFYVDVIDTEWADEDETVEKEGGGWWTSVIKDESQLDEVFEYYVKGE